MIHVLKFRTPVSDKMAYTNSVDPGQTAPVWPGSTVFAISLCILHYENMPIQIYWKFYHLKQDIFQTPKTQHFSDKKFWYLSYFCSKHKNNNVYPCKPQFYYIKVGFKGASII